MAKVDALITAFVEDNYPGWRELSEIRDWEVKPARKVAPVEPDHVTLRLTTSCLEYVLADKSEASIFWEIPTSEVLLDVFAIRLGRVDESAGPPDP